MKLTHEQKLSLLSQLIKMASADGHHRDEEYDMLHLVAEQLEIEPMEMEALFTTQQEFIPPKTESKRIVIFYHLLKMVWADGELELDEIHLLKEYSMNMGLPIQAVNAIIERSRVYDQGNIPVQEIVDIFQVHHN
ncbi:MAG: hypothetical protein HN542_06170 [Flavobacteriales bacterium]|jgi:uncharacterized tellurite resistance protein B-like protein|nr:hypothetical protein [Flavobacteriales bacterium]NCG30844.1 hypothetical protein [Bacteroidota bacterium]MBT3962993.1 hypothetical protein [Flavobacteriales bacterium]MBT4703955.1 hypothetical protein [Flavobacteriales bacterium]MBT4930349.1 hypothetical protein [Flavobacteriales bacterium]